MIRTPFCLVAALSLLASAHAQDLRSTLVVSDLLRPVWVGAAPGDTSRLFVIEYRKISIVRDGAVLDEPFLATQDGQTFGDEQDLWAVAFHPDFENNQRLFVLYDDSFGDSCLAEYTIDPENPDRIDYASHTLIFGPVFQPDDIHNFSDLHFGPDGMLYVTSGDGGPQYDPQNRAQDPTQPFGKILRYDVDAPFPHIPSDNPYVGDPNGHDAVFHIGLRSPWRMSFDPLTGDLYVGDVGQDWVEEISVVPGVGFFPDKNFGWRCSEGAGCTDLGGCVCGDPEILPPLLDYVHTEGRCAVIAGHVYRGSAIPDLDGQFFYADHCTGRIFSFAWSLQEGLSELQEWTDQLTPPGEDLDLITTFGLDAEGELYFIELSGNLWKIERNDPNPIPFCAGDEAEPGCGLCPCGNGLTMTGGGCLNGAGRSAELVSTGDASASADTLRFELASGNSNTFAVLVSGQNALPTSGPCPAGSGVVGGVLDGLRCVGGGLIRHGTRALDSQGDAGLTNSGWGGSDGPASGILTQGGFQVGQTRHFQVFYREDPALSCMTGQNTSNGVTRIVQP